MIQPKAKTFANHELVTLAVFLLGEVGNLVAKDTSVWGLGPFFRRRGGEPGDTLTIRFDLKGRVAVVELGDEPSDDSRASADIDQLKSASVG